MSSTLWFLYQLSYIKIRFSFYYFTIAVLLTQLQIIGKKVRRVAQFK